MSVESILRNKPEYPYFIASVRGPSFHSIIFVKLSEHEGINLPIKSPIVVSSVNTKMKFFSGFIEFFCAIHLAIEVTPTSLYPVNNKCLPFEIAISAYLSTSFREADS